MSQKRKKAAPRRRVLKWVAGIFFVFFALTVLEVSSLRVFTPPFTVNMAWDWLFQRDSEKQGGLLNYWLPLARISPHLRKAVLAGEDQRFLDHHGFDFLEMDQAVRDLVLRKGLRGASTITMQTARTVFLWPSRSLLRKLAEAYYTLLMEIFWDKERILEVYLNTVDWGKGIRGAEAASRRYFRVSAGRLSPSQAAFLAAILPNPHDWSPTRPNAQVLQRQQRILRDMAKMPLVTSS